MAMDVPNQPLPQSRGFSSPRVLDGHAVGRGPLQSGIPRWMFDEPNPWLKIGWRTGYEGMKGVDVSHRGTIFINHPIVQVCVILVIAHIVPSPHNLS